MFEVGGNTANNAFQLAMQQCCVTSCSNLLLVLLHLYIHADFFMLPNGKVVCCVCVNAASAVEEIHFMANPKSSDF